MKTVHWRDNSRHQHGVSVLPDVPRKGDEVLTKHGPFEVHKVVWHTVDGTVHISGYHFGVFDEHSK